MNRIEQLESVLLPHLKENMIFSSGAMIEEIRGLEEELGVELPDAVKEIFLFANGQKESLPLFEGYWLCSINEILSVCKTIKEDLASGDYDGAEGEPVGGVKPYYYNNKWIPIFCSDNQNLSVDLDPGENGKIGQIVEVIYDDEIRVVVSDGIEEFLDKLICMIKSGELSFNNEYEYFASSKEGTVASLFKIS